MKGLLRAGKSVGRWLALGRIRRAWFTVVFIISVLFGYVFDFNFAHQSEDKTDARNSKATVLVRWVSVLLATAGVTFFVASASAFWRGYVGFTADPGWGWLLRWTLDIPLFSPFALFTANLPTGALAPLAVLFIWAIWANRITVAKKAKNPDPQPHTWAERYERTPLFWVMFGFSMLPAGAWLVLDGIGQSAVVPDDVISWVSAAPVLLAALLGIRAALRIRGENKAVFEGWQQFDIKMNSALRLPVDTLAKARLLKGADQRYFTEEIPGDGIRVTLPPEAWAPLRDDNRTQLLADIAVAFPNREAVQVWSAGITLMPVSAAETTRRLALDSSGKLTSVPLGFAHLGGGGRRLTPADY